MSASSALAPILGHLRAEPSRTWSLIITLYGDALVPRGGRLWLGTLLEVFDALEIGGNVVRTAMSRLAADGWLERRRIGRNSYYRLADKGQETFAEAARRIYRAHSPEWDGAFRIAVLGPTDRDSARTALETAGYAPLAPGVLVAAAPADGAVVPADAIAMRATAEPEDARRLAAHMWQTRRLGDGYRRFVAAFTPLGDVVAGGGAPAGLGGLDSLVARLLLIHEYRRLVLHDPMLPAALLPPDWGGLAARALCGRLYPALLPPSERWLDEHGMNEDGRLPAAEASLYERFRP
jgi:phenylacetic acid degradation operon negative regulatory protein